jgi:ATP-dependent DNA ligase
VYDIPRTDDGEIGGWENRREYLNELYEMLVLYENKCTGIIPVLLFGAKDEEDVYKLQSQFLEEGYEGAIVREMDGEYRFGYRSNKLLKVKNFCDEEYEIVGFTTGVGRFEGCIIWICVTEDGICIDSHEFKVVPQGTMEERKAMYDEAEDHIGEFLKVKFFELTDDGIPRFPVGLGIRLMEDM